MKSTRRDALLSGLGAAGAAALPASLEARSAGPRARSTEGQRAADLENGRFLNPVMAGDHPDPSILKDGDTYYQVASSFIYYPGLVIWRSTDLINWSPVGPALREPIGSVYAPDLIKHGGRYYIYIAVRSVPQQPPPAGAPRAGR